MKTGKRWATDGDKHHTLLFRPYEGADEEVTELWQTEDGDWYFSSETINAKNAYIGSSVNNVQMAREEVEEEIARYLEEQHENLIATISAFSLIQKEKAS